MRILIVEDERRLADTLGEILRGQKYGFDIVYNGLDGLDYAQSGIYDLILLDVMLPGMDGFTVLQKLRAQKNNTPVILLTAKDEIEDKIKGLDHGADDYITKPFSTGELLARVRAATRRQGELVLDKLDYGDILLNLSAGTLHCGDQSVRLGFKELEVLRLLMAAKGTIVSKEELLTKVWGYDSNAEDNNVEVYISFLRKKLAFVGSNLLITASRRLGYSLAFKGE